MTTVVLGDLRIRMRPWPLPNSAKVKERVGMLSRGGRLLLVDPSPGGRWALPGVGMASDQPERDWEKIVDPRGWFWLTEPPSLRWKEQQIAVPTEPDPEADEPQPPVTFSARVAGVYVLREDGPRQVALWQTSDAEDATWNDAVFLGTFETHAAAEREAADLARTAATREEL